MARPIEVAIVGAGLAGLRCADVLLRHGCKVTIFEARNRIGGRVAQSKHLGHLVDLGPNWIHGAKDSNPISKLARTSGTTTCPWDDGEAVFDADGRLMDDTEAEEYQRILWEELVADASEYSREHRDTIDAQRSLYDFLEEKVEGLFTIEPPQEAKRKRRTLLLVASAYGAWVGSPIQKQSLRNFWLEDWIEGENVFVAETYSKILEEVATSARTRAEIRLQSEVTGIQSVGGTNGLAESKVSVQTVGGKDEFDEVVMTTPLGWLKHNQEKFEPSLPTRLSQAIANIGYGTLDKVYITFPSAFWEADSSHDRIAVGKPGPSPSDDHKHWPGFTNWLPPIYTPHTNPEQWVQEAMNLAALPTNLAHPTLLFYIQGPCSVHIAKLVAGAQSEGHGEAALIAFFKPYYSLLPNFDEANPACTPKAVLATAWANDRFAGYGSYSNFQVGLENGAADLEVMRHGMPERNVWFAGEHTAPVEFVATTTGAYLSGEAVAERIAKKRGLGR